MSPIAPALLVITLLGGDGKPTGGYTIPAPSYFDCLHTVSLMMEHYKTDPPVNSKMVCIWTSEEAEAAEAASLRVQGILPREDE